MAGRAPSLTPLGVMLLALLREASMHPYEMKRLLRERREDRLVPVTTGAVYHSVGRLEEQGLIAPEGSDREGNRPERTIYAITPAGDEAVTEWVRRELAGAGREVDFRVALAEAHNLDYDEAIALLAKRRDALAEDLAFYELLLRTAGERGVEEMFLLESARRRHLLAAELDWIDDLLDRMRAGDVRWLHDLLGADAAAPATPHDHERTDA